MVAVAEVRGEEGRYKTVQISYSGVFRELCLNGFILAPVGSGGTAIPFYAYGYRESH